MQIKFKGRYFDMNKNAVHLDDENVQELIDNVAKELTNSNKIENDFAFQATGDTLVAGVKWEEDESIDIIVTQDYNSAHLEKNVNDKYEALDWSKEEDGEELSLKELTDELYALRREVQELRKAEYNPRKEVWFCIKMAYLLWKNMPFWHKKYNILA